jgi:hypothetical protein
MQIPISAKLFATFVLSGPSSKAKIVKNVMKPKAKEAQVIVLYYARAIRIIRLYHAANNDKAYLEKEIAALETKLEKAPTPQARSSIHNNIRAVKAYIDVYGSRKRKVVPRPRVYYQHSSVRISGSPDLAIEESGKLRLVKLGITKGGDNLDTVRIMLRVMYQAAATKLAVEPWDIVYFDVANAARIHGDREDSYFATIIDNGCETLASMC